MNWSSEEDEILIEFVRANEILFNVKNKNYRQAQLKIKLWCEVGEILNKADSDCYKRWCYVRDYYIRRKVKPGTGSTGEAARKRSKLLSFLDNYSSLQRTSITNVVEIDNPGENTEDDEEQTPSQSDIAEDISDTCNRNDKTINKQFEGNLKRKKMMHTQKHFVKQIVHRKPSLENMDETDLFFSSMAKIVKKLPRVEQVQLRMQIGSLVGNAELCNIANDDPLCISSRRSSTGSDY